MHQITCPQAGCYLPSCFLWFVVELVVPIKSPPTSSILHAFLSKHELHKNGALKFDCISFSIWFSTLFNLTDTQYRQRTDSNLALLCSVIIQHVNDCSEENAWWSFVPVCSVLTHLLSFGIQLCSVQKIQIVEILDDKGWNTAFQNLFTLY